MMLHLIGEHPDEQIVTKVCEQALTHRMRAPIHRQRLPLRAAWAYRTETTFHHRVDREVNIAELLSLSSRIAKMLGSCGGRSSGPPAASSAVPRRY